MSKPIVSIDLPIFVDCVEFCGFSKNQYLACGLYQLKDDELQKRIGGMEIFRFNDSIDGISIEKFSYYHMDAGVLGLRWINDERIIAACSDGQIRIMKSNEHDQLILENSLSISECNILILTVEIDSDSKSFLTGDSSGYVCIGTVENLSHSWPAHENSEVWCVDFHRGDKNLLFSGADDCLLKGWDRRMTSESNARPIYQLRHEAGVTSILSTFKSELIWSGSYDDHLRFWDLRHTKSALFSLNLGGGVWRIRPNGRYLLCACMYNGWCIVDCRTDVISGGDLDTKKISVEYADNSHGSSLLYGVDWMPGRDGIIASSTFYDYTVRVYDIAHHFK